LVRTLVKKQVQQSKAPQPKPGTESPDQPLPEEIFGVSNPFRGLILTIIHDVDFWSCRQRILTGYTQ